MNELQYDVFISYARSDCFDHNGKEIPGNAVSKIMAALSAEGISYWFDKDCIYHGDDFAEKIISNIEGSRLFVFISSAAANNSKWTRKEVASADMMKKIIIPFRIDNSPYDKAVMLRIVDLDYIDATNNIDQSIQELISSLKGHLENINRAILAKRQALANEIADIEIAITELCAATSQVELKFKQVAKRIRGLESKEAQMQLANMIPSILRTPPLEQVKEIVRQNQQLQTQVNELQQEANELRNNLEVERAKIVKFNDELVLSYNDGLFGYINKKTGTVELPYKYTYAKDFSEGLAVVSFQYNGGKYYYIDPKGNLAFPFSYEEARSFKEGMARVMLNNKYGFINKQGELVIPYQYDYANSFSEGLVSVRKDLNGVRKYGFIDKAGQVVIPIKYDDADSFKNGYARVRIGNTWRMVDKAGKEYL